MVPNGGRGETAEHISNVPLGKRGLVDVRTLGILELWGPSAAAEDLGRDE